MSKIKRKLSVESRYFFLFLKVVAKQILHFLIIKNDNTYVDKCVYQNNLFL